MITSIAFTMVTNPLGDSLQYGVVSKRCSYQDKYRGKITETGRQMELHGGARQNHIAVVDPYLIISRKSRRIKIINSRVYMTRQQDAMHS